MRWLTMVLVPGLAVAVSVAFADTITLKNGGGRLEGRIVAEDEQRVVIRTPQGTIRVARARIESVRKAKSVYDAFDEKAAQVKGDDAKELARLAQWAESNRLLPESVAVYRKVLELDPRHAAARKAVDGYETRPIGSGGRGGGPGSSERKIVVRGKERAVLLFAPKNYAGEPTPLLVWLHGDGGDRRTCADGITQNADKAGFLVIGAEGENRTWKDFKSDKGCEDDEYLMGAIEEAKRQYNVDLVRIFVAGHSRGGTYASRIGADYGELFAAGGLHNGVWISQPGAQLKRRTPFFIYSGENDYLAKEYGRGWDRAEAEGHEVKRHTLAGAGHEPHWSAYEEMFKWFKTRSLPKSVLWGD